MSALTPEVQYAELIALTRRYLSQEWKGGDSLYVSEAEADYFAPWTKQRTPAAPIQQKKVDVTRPIPRQTPRPRPKSAPSPSQKAQKPASPPPVRREEPDQHALQSDLGELPQLMKKLFPTLPLLAAPPDDTSARTIKERWRKKKALPSIAILVGENENATLLVGIARAVDREEARAAAIPVERIDREIGWNTFFSHKELTRVLVSRQTIQSHPELKPIFDEERGTVGETSLLLLPSPETLMGNVEEKRSLWNQLKRELSL